MLRSREVIRRVATEVIRRIFEDGTRIMYIATQIDDDVPEAYWTAIRNLPDRVKETETL